VTLYICAEGNGALTTDKEANMEDTRIVIVIGAKVCTVLINECKDGSPWLARYGGTIDGAPCELEAIDDAMVEAFDIPEQVSWNWEHDDALEAVWDRILVPALAALLPDEAPKCYAPPPTDCLVARRIS
jgi:hypothetical protein